jgi:uncharacterized membrane protein HdeD (DUF308 family)
VTTNAVDRDERTTAVEHASYRLGYLFLSYGALLIVAYRSFARNESPWDLLALVILAGAVTTGYQARHQILGRRWAVVTLGAVLAAAAVAAGLAIVR